MIAHRVEIQPLLFAALVLLLCLTVGGALATTPRLDGWVLEPDVDTPGYAATQPVSTNLNIDTIVLVCEEGASSRMSSCSSTSQTKGSWHPMVWQCRSSSPPRASKS